MSDVFVLDPSGGGTYGAPGARAPPKILTCPPKFLQ